MLRNKYFWVVLFLVLLAGCSQSSSDRNTLTYNDLMEGFPYRSPLDEAALTIPEGAAAPRHVFEGRLELLGEDRTGEIKFLRGGPAGGAHLPEFDFEFVQQDSYLIPVQRSLIVTPHQDWNYFLEPGRVWYEPADGDYSRASFPFALSWKGSNAIHNGTMTFLFDDGGISRVWYQVTQETALELRFDMWGLLEAVYHPHPLADAGQIRTDFLQELADRMPVKPIETLIEDFPAVDLSAFGDGVTPEAMTWYGFVVDGVNYLGGCHTRYGVYPYCEYMRAPSYSTAKSAFASLALMRLAQKYDPGVADFLVRDYVPEASASTGDWSQVSFDHVLDMASGNFRTSARMVDEEQWDSDPFWSQEYYQPRIEAAFNWPHSAPPGTTWVYRTSDTFIVTRAMQGYLGSLEGPHADIFDFVVQEVYIPLKMGPGVYATLRTRDDDWQGQPYGGYGLWWVPDDLAKITTLLNVDHGRIGGQQILHPALLDKALQRDPLDRGVSRDGSGYYNNAFWADAYDLGQGSGCSVWVPQMYGLSGIVVTLMPNGTAYYYASDNQEFVSRSAIQESDRMIPMCPE